MKKNKEIWERSFEAFAGPGIHHPSDMMRVTDSEARDLLAAARQENWGAPVYAGRGRHDGYEIRNAEGSWTTALFKEGTMVGLYAGSCLWIGRGHRGLGLSTPLILAAAEHRSGSIMPPGVVVQGYTAVGLLAHRAAHGHAVLTAVAEGRPVPPEVLAELAPAAETLPA